jgi:ParB family chromosome partitioning protein
MKGFVMTIIKKEKPRHLGRGLQSLIGPIISSNIEPQTVSVFSIDSKFPPDKDLNESLKEISIDSILSNPFQPRNSWDIKELEDLAESIKVNGIIQPVIVRPAGQNFELIAGERRFRAAKIAELKTIPAIVRKASDEELLELALIENIHRTDLNPIERAKAFKNYMVTFNLTQQEVANRLGKDRSDVANYIRLLDLPDQVQQMLIDGQLSMGHARAILALPTDELRQKLANRAMAGRLSVREVERLVKQYTADTNKKTRPLPIKPPHILDLENRLTSELGTKVTIETQKNGQKGKIIIEFYSIDEFDRITEQIGLSAKEEVY